MDYENKHKETIEIPFGAKDSKFQEATFFVPDGYHAEINGNEVVIKKGKQKATWKPTEEQIKALEDFVRSVGESGYASPYDNNTKLIYSLLEQLKKL